MKQEQLQNDHLKFQQLREIKPPKLSIATCIR